MLVNETLLVNIDDDSINTDAAKYRTVKDSFIYNLEKAELENVK
jgi:hypothetical protein